MPTKETLEEFRGKPLVRLPDEVPQADLLSAKFGRAFLKEYDRMVKLDFGSHKTLENSFGIGTRHGQQVVRGGNVFSYTLANQILEEFGLRIPTPSDFLRISKCNLFSELLKGGYILTAIALRRTNIEDPNSYIARDLETQLKEIRERDIRAEEKPFMSPGKSLTLREKNRIARGVIKKNSAPLVIPLGGLKVRLDDKSPYGLAFDFTKRPYLIPYMPLLSGHERLVSICVDKNTGLPTNSPERGEIQPNALVNSVSSVSGLGISPRFGINIFSIDKLAKNYTDGLMLCVRDSYKGKGLAEYLSLLEKSGELLSELKRKDKWIQDERERAEKEFRRGYEKAWQELREGIQKDKK